LGWIGALSFASGLPYFFFTETVPVWLAVSGMTIGALGFTSSSATLPWVLKFLWAPLVDRLGTRRLWIRICLGLLAAVTAVLAGADPVRHAGQLAAVLLLYVALSATQDIAIDAYTIDTTHGRELGVANSVRIGAYRAASFVSSALLVWIAGRSGWHTAFLAGAGLFAGLAVATLVLPSPSRATAHPASLGEPIRALLARPGIWWVVGFALLFKLDISAMEWMTKPFWVASGFSLEQIATLTTGRLLATLGGAALGGVIASRIGIFHALWSLGMVQLLSSLGYAAAAASGAGKSAIVGAALFENFAAGLGTAAFLAFLMSVCERRYAATQFALLSAVFALSRMLVGLPSGTMVEHLGYARYFFLTFLMGLPAYLLLPRIRHASIGE
jgi:PAT family beta-lactamase induction signal transducer AmpG